MYERGKSRREATGQLHQHVHAFLSISCGLHLLALLSIRGARRKLKLIAEVLLHVYYRNSKLESYHQQCRNKVFYSRLQGKVAIVTGAASAGGIGAEAVRVFVENGAFVVIADIDDELGNQIATSIGLDKVSYHHCDVRDEKQVEETVAFTLEKYGSLDIMFSNAGIVGPVSSILEFDLNEFDNTMAVNVRGMAATIKHAARVMVARKIRGSIICTASVAASVAGTGGHGYITSKHGLIGLVRSTCSELGAYGIRVNSISPYIVATPLICRKLGMELGEIEATGFPSANLHGITLKATHIAEAALFLASDESAYISGHNLVVDGGFSVINRFFPNIK